MAGITGLIAALVVTLVWGFVATRFGPQLGWVDQPDDAALKAHRRPAVPLGGVGLFLGVQAGAVITGRFDWRLLAASGLLVGTGLVDDKTGLPPPIRLAVEVVSGLILASAVAAADWPRAVLTTLLVVVAVNAVNLFDGLDGLAGLSGLVAALGVVGLAVGRGASPTFGLILAGAAVGFLVWNWHPARLFLGDNGAYVLALFLVYGMARTSQTMGEMAVAAALFGVFFFDMAATLLRRVMSRQPMFSRDRLHLYDRLVERGLSTPHVAIAAGCLQAVFAVVVIAADRVLDIPIAVAALLIAGGIAVWALIGYLRATRPGPWLPQ